MIETIKEIYRSQLTNFNGNVSDYCEVLRNADPDKFALSIIDMESGTVMGLGDTKAAFSLQSISKVFSLMLAFETVGLDGVYSCVGREPSGDSFDSLSLSNNNLPANPLVNSGALTVSGIIADHYGDKAEDVLQDMFSECAGEKLFIDEKVHEQELHEVHRNRSILHMLKHMKLISDIERTLEVYSYACAINVTSKNLAVMAGTLANKGVNPVTKRAVFMDAHQIQHTLSHMMVSGMYGESGQWVIDVGCPAKSGISGGLMLSIPERYGVGIYSPRLDKIGNSVRGIEVANRLDDTLNIHVIPLL